MEFNVVIIRKHTTATRVVSSFLFATLTICAQDAPWGRTDGDGSHARSQREGAGAPEIIPHRQNSHDAVAPTSGSTGTMTPDITFHGGPVMGSPNVYLIWYGNWNQSNASDTASGKTIVKDFLHGLSGSPYYLTNTSYGAPTGMFTVKGEYTDSYSQGSSLTDAKVQSVVSTAIHTGKMGPADPNGIYFVLSSSDVAETSGFCSKYCGWHSASTIVGSNIKYAFVGNANRCLSSCAAQTSSPNGNAGVDGMVSVLAHELEEANTDPNLNAWYDAHGAEDADKCAWTFGSNLQRSSNGAYYNMTLTGQSGNSRDFLVQRELDMNNKCYVDYVNKIQ
jgi:Phosphate-induced protein 1 conserved region